MFKIVLDHSRRYIVERFESKFSGLLLNSFILHIIYSLRNGESLKLGDLFGNRFKIVIRECDEQDESLIKSGIDSLKNNGFINYFGLQRFGNCAEIPTHSIGK